MRLGLLRPYFRSALLPAALLLLGGSPAASADPPRTVGPTQILYVDADTVRVLRTLQWHSAASRHQEKLLLHGLRMAYWRDHIPADMRMVFDALGYPVGRSIHSHFGQQEERWVYGLLDPPLRFRDGVLVDRDRFESYRSR